MEEQIAILYLGTKGVLMDVPLNRVKEFESKFLDLMRGAHPEILDSLRAGKYDDSLTSVLEKVARDLKTQFIEK